MAGERKEHPDSSPDWAERLAIRRGQQQTQTPGARPDWATLAMRALWDMFDDAAGVAEEALERHGLPDRILAERTDNEYRLTMPGPDGRERRIVVFANVATVEGHISGGGHISTSETRATVNLVPAVHAGRIQWRVAASNHQISPRLVSDLFLSVFTDDPAATKRLESSFTTTP